jgi:hypothetical protein
MYTPDIPTYKIDLSAPEDDRWAEVISHDIPVARTLCAKAMEDYAFMPASLVKAGGWALDKVYAAVGGRYRGEIAAWANALGISQGEATLLNCSYEMSHVGQRLFGCTAGVRWIEGLGMVHVRNMDWPLPTIGPATRLFHFVDGGLDFYSVGMAGHVSVLSGMLPGGYSVTINWAPPVGLPSFDWGPSFLLREVLETKQTFAEAVEALIHTPLSTSVFFVVCGVEPDEACVIERTADDAAVRWIGDGPLVQANHHVASDFIANNEAFEDLADSKRRAKTLKRELGKIKKAVSLDFARVLVTLRWRLGLKWSWRRGTRCSRGGEGLVQHGFKGRDNRA